MMHPSTGDSQATHNDDARTGGEHQGIWPSILYFGTPVALVTTMNADQTPNIGPMSSAWALGYTVVMGWESTAHTFAKVTAIHEPATRPDGEHFRIIETHVQRVHALASIIKPGTNHIDPQHWSPLLYVFRHYFATGQKIRRSFRAED